MAVFGDSGPIPASFRRSSRQRCLAHPLLSPRQFMSIHRAFVRASVALALTSVPFFTPSAFGQSSASQPAPPDPASTSAQPAPAAAPQPPTERYRDGIIIWETPPDVQVPFLLK